MAYSTLGLVLVVLSGRVLDRTTGQPLPGVTVTTLAGKHAKTDAKGRYTLRGLHFGALVLILESDDVPPQRIEVRIGSSKTLRDVRACSTKLDYNCGAKIPSGEGKPRAG